MNASPPLVLAAEDDETDALILRLVFERAGLPNPLAVVGDGEEAVDYLSGSGRYTDRTVYRLPALLLLDLKMPRMSGFDVLAWLATRPDLKDLPVVVFSSSSDSSDIQKARQMGARDYFVKPHDLSQFEKIIQSLHTRWLSSASADLRPI